MSFFTRQVNTQTLGEYLRERRNHLELSINEAANLSQVQPKYLLALEKGLYNQLPADVYVKGFLRSLAKVYRIDEAALLELFEAERRIEINIAAHSQKASAPRRSILPKFVLSPKTITIAIIAGMGILSLGYLYFQVSSLSAAPRLELFSPDRDQQVSSSQLLVRGSTEPGAGIMLNNQPIVVDAKGDFLENISLAPGTNQLEIRATNKFNKESVLVRNIIYKEKAVAGAFDGETAQTLRLEVSIASTPAWIYLEADGREVYSGTMLVGAKRTVSADETIVLTTGNAGSTRLVFNGDDLGILGEQGEVIRDIEFTR